MWAQRRERIDYKMFRNHIIVSQKENAHTKTSYFTSFFAVVTHCSTPNPRTRDTHDFDFSESIQSAACLHFWRIHTVESTSTNATLGSSEWMNSILQLAHPMKYKKLNTDSHHIIITNKRLNTEPVCSFNYHLIAGVVIVCSSALRKFEMTNFSFFIIIWNFASRRWHPPQFTFKWDGEHVTLELEPVFPFPPRTILSLDNVTKPTDAGKLFPSLASRSFPSHLEPQPVFTLHNYTASNNNKLWCFCASQTRQRECRGSILESQHNTHSNNS